VATPVTYSLVIALSMQYAVRVADNMGREMWIIFRSDTYRVIEMGSIQIWLTLWQIADCGYINIKSKLN